MPEPALLDEALSEFDVPDFEELPEDLQERITEETERAGFTPNVFSAMARRPRQFRAFFEYHDALVKESPLERHEIEMLVVVTSGVNECLYCVVAHGALVRVYTKDPHLADKLATNWRSADLSARHEAMCSFAEQLTASPGSIGHAEMEVLREHFSDEELWDIVTTVGFYNLSNRLATAFGMAPNDEFYQLGR
jgi:uncharacterized peroxidase-related enzyme